jgi:hypothetical protein
MFMVCVACPVYLVKKSPGPGRGERLAEPADADRHLMAGGSGRVIVPQRLGQPVARDHLAVFH